MPKYVVYLICIIVLPIIASCSKEETVSDPIPKDAQIADETGISFANSSGFLADHVIYKLKSGASREKEYGQSLEGYNYTKLESGTKTIFQMEVFKDGEQVPFQAYTKDADGTEKAVKSTSIVTIKNNQVFEIILENEE